MFKKSRLSIVVMIMAMIGVVFGAQRSGAEDQRISGPFTHGNLAVYFVHGRSEPGPAPLTLQEALAKGVIRVNETGNVNRLTVDNLGDEAVFVQSGTIVKGGQQDRLFVSSLLLSPHAERIAVDVYCVELGRWSPRGQEDAYSFASANAIVPSQAAKHAIQAPEPAGTVGSGHDSVYSRQQAVWQDVARIQDKLSASLGQEVAAPQSQSSLQLALENEALAEAEAGYVESLFKHGEDGDDIVGYAFAINGRINSADIYPSNGLFRKMWQSLLTASVTEALAEQAGGQTPAAPDAGKVSSFIEAGKAGSPTARDIDDNVSVLTRSAPKVMSFEAVPTATGAWVHRSYLAR